MANRGRPVSGKLSFPKFVASVRKGAVPDGAHYVSATVENGVITPAQIVSDGANLEVTEDGTLRLVRYATEGPRMTPREIVEAQAKAEDVITWLNSRK